MYVYEFVSKYLKKSYIDHSSESIFILKIRIPSLILTSHTATFIVRYKCQFLANLSGLQPDENNPLWYIVLYFCNQIQCLGYRNHLKLFKFITNSYIDITVTSTSTKAYIRQYSFCSTNLGTYKCYFLASIISNTSLLCSLIDV